MEIRKGITLIESLFVLGVMAVLIGMVMVLFSMANASLKSQKLINEATQLIEIANEINNDRSTYTGMNNSVLAKTGMVPNEFINSGQVVTPWGGEIDVIPFNYAGSNAPDVYLAFNFLSLPREACEKLGIQDFGGTAQSVTVTNMREDDPDGFSPIKVVKNCENGNNNYVNIRVEH